MHADWDSFIVPAPVISALQWMGQLVPVILEVSVRKGATVVQEVAEADRRPVPLVTDGRKVRRVEAVGPVAIWELEIIAGSEY